ncbi:MAG: helix-hairpin-helix domain-containing protein [Bacteroidaceae bacterium]|nr:helix-hairpin-helix domain-containing protein [Bacteroidaceae bacterium]
MAQESYVWNDFVEEFTTSQETENEQDVLLSLEELKELHEHPLNINTATVEDLQQLPFLSEPQIESIHAYIYLHGQMQTLGELLMLPLIDAQTYKWLHLFVYAVEVTQKEKEKDRLFAHLRNDFSIRTDIPLYRRKGYSITDGYAGNPLYQRMKYELGNSKHFRAGFHIEKDAGEKFYDSYGGFAMLRDVGIVKTAVVGDYRIGLGEGLALGGSAWFSKTTPATKPQTGIKPLTSTDEINFLRGAAVTLKPWQGWEVTAFASFRQKDATLNQNGEIQTLQTSGYHRSASERKGKNSATATTAGGAVSWQGKGLHIGATGYFMHFNKTMNPGSAVYRRYYPKGRNFAVASLYYGYSRYRFSLAGEAAYSTEKGGIGTLNRLQWIISKRYTLSAVQRFYGYKYYSFLGRAFAENSSAQNESGVLLHLKAQPWERWQIVCYADFFHNPWPRYRMSSSSSGQELMVEVTHQLNKTHTLQARYQLKRKEQGDVMEPHHRIKLQWTCTPSGKWKFQTTGWHHSVLESIGWSIQETAYCTLQKPSLRLAFMAGYFCTDDYYSRIYLYEPSLYNSISSAQYFGKGIHGVCTARWTSPNKRLMLEGKYSLCKYFDRTEQGSALQTIFSSWKNDISLQLRVVI